MSYKMIIVDDEPPFIRMLENCLLKETDQIRLIESANNGVEALEKIKQLKPDIIFSDIRMPVMDGLELAKQVKTLFPEIIFVLVSSYREFEYAKRAMQIGVEDYLLKPIEQNAMAELLEKVLANLAILMHKKRENLLKSMVLGLGVEYNELLKAQQSKGYYLMIVKTGYSPQLTLVLHENVTLKKIIIQTMEPIKKERCNYVIVSEEEDMEAILILESQNVDARYLKKIVMNLTNGIQSKTNLYTTIAYHITEIQGLQLNEMGKKLRGIMKTQLVLGLNQQIDCEQALFQNEKKLVIEDEIEKKLNYLMQKRMVQQIKSELVDLFQDWEIKEYPLYIIDNLLKQILTMARKYDGDNQRVNALYLYQQLDEILAIATSFGELLNGFWDILSHIFDEDNANQYLNSEHLVKGIESYIQQNLANDLSLQQICDVFGVSQPYISRIFRKNRNCSYNTYVINHRIDYAKLLIQSDTNILLKDVAVRVGYQDHHYFSRIFKKTTGISPTEFQLGSNSN